MYILDQPESKRKLGRDKPPRKANTEVTDRMGYPDVLTITTATELLTMQRETNERTGSFGVSGGYPKKGAPSLHFRGTFYPYFHHVGSTDGYGLLI